MVLEIRVFAETAVADVTLEGPGAVMDVHVRLEVSGRGEGLGAQTALVRLLLKQKNKNQFVTVRYTFFWRC